MARANEVTITVTGKSVHLSRAAEGRDALAAGLDYYRRALELVEALPPPRVLGFGRMVSGTVRNAVSGETILEGSLEPRPVNVAVYCTSNRRHLVRQNFSDRNGDEIDASETIQDKTSLADRFGLRILYSELTKPQFSDMAMEMAVSKGVTMDPDDLKKAAVRWEARHTSRSPRSALQFAASLLTAQI